MFGMGNMESYGKGWEERETVESGGSLSIKGSLFEVEGEEQKGILPAGSDLRSNSFRYELSDTVRDALALSPPEYLSPGTPSIVLSDDESSSPDTLADRYREDSELTLDVVQEKRLEEALARFVEISNEIQETRGNEKLAALGAPLGKVSAIFQELSGYMDESSSEAVSGDTTERVQAALCDLNISILEGCVPSEFIDQVPGEVICRFIGEYQDIIQYQQPLDNGQVIKPSTCNIIESGIRIVGAALIGAAIGGVLGAFFVKKVVVYEMIIGGLAASITEAGNVLISPQARKLGQQYDEWRLERQMEREHKCHANDDT